MKNLNEEVFSSHVDRFEAGVLCSTVISVTYQRFGNMTKTLHFAVEKFKKIDRKIYWKHDCV